MPFVASPVLWPAPRPLPAHRVDASNFFAALVLAPILFALFTFWAFLIPVFAIFFGGIPYLLIGGPVFWKAIELEGPYAPFAALAFVANFLGTPVATALYLSLTSDSLRVLEISQAIAFMTGFGMIIAPFWGLTFGWLYRFFTQEKEA